MACGRLLRNSRACWHGMLLLLALCLPSSPCLAATPGPYKILLLLSGDDKAYDEAARSLSSSLLRSAGRALPFDIRRQVLPPEGAISLSRPDSLLDADYAVVVPIGTAASRAVKTAGGDTPVLNILTTKDAFDAVWSPAGRSADRHVSAIYLEQPVSRQIRFIRLTLPRHTNCGVLLGRNSLGLKPDLGAAAAESRLHLNAIDISVARTPIDGIRDVIASNDVILAVPDAEVLTPNIAKWLLYMAYQKEIPVIGFSRAIVDAGALAAIYSTPEQIGRQAAEIILRAALDARDKHGTAWRLPPAQYPGYFEVAINESVARSLRIRVRSGSFLARSLLNQERSGSWRAQN